MISVFYKLLFDLSLYQTVSGFLLFLFTGHAAARWGLPLLLVSGTASVFFRGKSRPLAVLMQLLPAAAVLFRPNVYEWVQFLPAAAYLLWILRTERYSADYPSFLEQFGMACKILPSLLLFLVFFWGQAADALEQSVPYAVLCLVCGVCFLRLLREEHQLDNLPGAGFRRMMPVLLFTGFCALVTIGRFPQALGLAVKYLYLKILSPVLFAVFIGAAFVLYYLLEAVAWLFRLFGKAPAVQPQEVMNAVQGFAPDAELTAQANSSPLWIKLLAYGLLAALTGLLLFWFFRKLAGQKAAAQEREPGFTETRESLLSPPGKKRRELFAPRQPREAVRYYYRKYLKACRKAGMELSGGDTPTSVEQKSRIYLGAPDETLSGIKNVYWQARYREGQDVSREQAEQARRLWKSLKEKSDRKE